MEIPFHIVPFGVKLKYYEKYHMKHSKNLSHTTFEHLYIKEVQTLQFRLHIIISIHTRFVCF